MIGRRISVVGATGSGKSCLSRVLAELLQLQMYELDEIRKNLPGGQLDTCQLARHVEDLIHQDEWIIDGHYVAIRHMIWQRADTVVFINYPLYVIFLQISNRYLKKKFHLLRHNGDKLHKPGLNIEPRNLEIWRQRWNRLVKTFSERQDYGRTLRLPQYDKLMVIELKSRKATRAWIKTLNANNIGGHGATSRRRSPLHMVE